MSGRIGAERAVFLLCDVQEAFREHTHCFAHVVHVAQLMLDAAAAFAVPVLATEQYPSRLGSTVAELALEGREGTTVYTKTLFSMLTPEVIAALGELPERKHAVLFGVEAHVCVLQTAQDLLKRGYEVFFLADGISSGHPLDRSVGIAALSAMGCRISTSESVLFQMLGAKEHAAFKAVSKAVKKKKDATASSDLVGL